MHRVISPLSNKDRYSCAFFNEGMLDKIVEALPGCVPVGEKPKYQPLRVEDHCIKRYAQSYTYGAGGSVTKAFEVASGKTKMDADVQEVTSAV
jgi:isopenicillin N synthase-like dioxygenase